MYRSPISETERDGDREEKKSDPKMVWLGSQDGILACCLNARAVQTLGKSGTNTRLARSGCWGLINQTLTGAMSARASNRHGGGLPWRLNPGVSPRCNRLGCGRLGTEPYPLTFMDATEKMHGLLSIPLGSHVSGFHPSFPFLTVRQEAPNSFLTQR